MSKLDEKTVISRNIEVAYAHIDDDLVVIGPQDHFFYGINAMGSIIWSLLEKRALSVGELCVSIQQEYEVIPTQCWDEVSQFIERMLTLNMLLILE